MATTLTSSRLNNLSRLPGTTFIVRVLVLLTLAVASLTGPQAALATTAVRYVKPAGMTTGTCNTWANACTLQYALGLAASGNQVWVKAGVYGPGATQSYTFTVPPGVAVYGGFAGTETLLTQRNPATHVTILSGDIAGDDINTDGNHIDEHTTDIQGSNSFHVVTMISGSTPVTSGTVLDGFTVTAGDGSSGGGLYCGGGDIGHECSPTLANLTFSGNRATWGGALMNYGELQGTSSPTLTNVTFRGNSAANQGGAMYNDGASFGTSNPILTNVTFSANSAGSGGAIFNMGSPAGSGSPVLTNVTFDHNTASASGGAIYNSGQNGHSSPTLTRVNFTTNSAQFGGAMFNNAETGGVSSPMLTNVTFTTNTASLSGGAMYNDGAGGTSSPALTAVTFNGNHATFDDGGAMYDNGETSGVSSPTLTNVTFSGNSAGGFGGGMVVDGHGGTSSPTLMNVTFSGNNSNLGGALYDDGANSGHSTPALTNAILWGDTATVGGDEIYNSTATPTIDHSIVQGSKPGSVWDTSLGTDGGGNLDADPKLNPLANNGGFTATRTLQKASPAVDTGTSTGCPSTDQRGIDRPQDGDGDGTPICDMGATEARYLTANLPSSATYDGWVLESGENTNIGGSLNSTGTTFNLGDDAAKRQYRAILSFNALLPSSATIASVTLRIKKAGQVGANPFSTLMNIVVDIRKGAFRNNKALQIGDFQAAASKNAVLTFTNAPLAGGWYSKALAAANFGYINKLGVTQFRLRFTKDDNNNLIANYLKFYSGNYGTASSRPVLVIQYYVP